MAWLPDEQNVTKLFHIGGLDPKTYEAVIPIEMFDEENGSWDIFRDIPSDQDHKFPESPDHGCLAVDNNFVYSVGLTNIVSLNWNTWEISQVFIKYHVLKFIVKISHVGRRMDYQIT